MHNRSHDNAGMIVIRRRTPKTLLAAVSWVLLVAVIFGGYSLLSMLTSNGDLTPFQEKFFRAGHAHAGVLTIVGLFYSTYLAETTLSYRAQMWTWIVYALGVGAVSGGFFLHMMIGKEGHGSAGTTLTGIGALIITGTVLFLAWHLFRARNTVWIDHTHNQERNVG